MREPLPRPLQSMVDKGTIDVHRGQTITFVRIRSTGVVLEHADLDQLSVNVSKEMSNDHRSP